MIVLNLSLATASTKNQFPSVISVCLEQLVICREALSVSQETGEEALKFEGVKVLVAGVGGFKDEGVVSGPQDRGFRQEFSASIFQILIRVLSHVSWILYRKFGEIK